VIVDAHHHLWDPSARRHAWLDGLPRIRRPFAPADYRAAAVPEGVTASVLVQVLASAGETEEFLALAASSGWKRREGREGREGRGEREGREGQHGPPAIAGVVGWADLTGAGISDEIARLRGLPGGDRLVGLRHLVESEPDPEWLARPDVLRGLAAVGEAGLVYDLLVRPQQLPAALRAASRLSEVRFVLDHGAKPEIAAGRYEPWARLIALLAALPNVTCKLSGLVTEAGAGWTADRIRPYTDLLLESFGPGRLMFGSDWPVCLLAASYHDVMALARTALDGRLSRAESDAVFGENAAAAYRLPVQ
jgi:L-fuconolactonase